MRIHKSLMLIAAMMASSVLAQLSVAQPEEPAPTLITNVNGYTMNSNRELVQFSALQFTGDTIDRVFTDADTLPADDALTIINGEGKTLLPGLIDAHGHVLNYGFSQLRVDMTGTRSEQEAVQRVIDFQQANPGLQWIQGRGWNQVLWDSNEFPSAETLAAAGVDTPMWFSRVDGHAGWANQAAIELAGIDATTPDPDGGMILRDADGRPTGTFVDTAMHLITRNIPQPTIEEQKMALRLAMQRLAEQGLTSVHDAGVGSSNLQAYRELLEEGPLPIRVYVMLAATDPQFAQHLAAGHFVSEDGTLTIRSVKISSDGALGSRGAYLNEDYSDQPGHRGLLLHSPQRLTQLMHQAMEAGFQVNVHAIGDGANMIVMDNFEALIHNTNTREQRHRIEHAQILRYEDIMRFSELGVIPSMQGMHATSDKNMAQDRIGEVRIHGAYAWRKLLDTGVIIANGSDFPVEPPNPFFGLHASITRQDQNNEPPGGWFPEERMTHEEALLSFTLDAAYAAHQENELGTLEPGKKADFILVEQDIFAIEPTEIWKTEVDKTWVGGRLVADQEAGWPGYFSGTKPAAGLQLPLNNIAEFKPGIGRIYTCLAITADNQPSSLGGVAKFDIAFAILSLEQGLIQVVNSRAFNPTNALTGAGVAPSCSGRFDTVSNLYTDTLSVSPQTFKVTFELIDGVALKLRLLSAEELK